MGPKELSDIDKQKPLGELRFAKVLELHEPTNRYLDLVAKSIHVIPEKLFKFPTLEYLYLESNRLQELPEDFFENLPLLKWLDLRDNRLEFLPASIGIHRNLKTLLLERNQLSHLPPELGNVTSITGLSLRGNPLMTPPASVIAQGVQVILSYLLDVLNDLGGTSDQKEVGSELHFPHVEQYSDHEDMISLESASDEANGQYEHELSQHGPSPTAAMFHPPKSKTNPWKEGIFSKGKRFSKVKVKDITLGNSSYVENKEQVNRKDWLAKMQEKKKNIMVLDEWRQEAKVLQKLLVPNTQSELDVSSPLPSYDVNHTIDGRPITKKEREIHVDAVEEKVAHVSPKHLKPKEKIENELEARLRQHTSRRRTSKQKDGSEDDILQPGRELQRELLNQKMSKNQAGLEYRFRAFTGDSSSASSSKWTSSL